MPNLRIDPPPVIGKLCTMAGMQVCTSGITKRGLKLIP